MCHKFWMPDVYWVDPSLGRVAILERPRGGEWIEDEARDLESKDVHGVVTLLTPEEIEELELQGEREALESRGLRFYSLPIPDGGTPPSESEARLLITKLAGLVKAGVSLGFHCRAGIGRSPMMAAAVLVASGVPLDRALKAIAVARGWPVPETQEQIGWLKEFAKQS